MRNRRTQDGYRLRVYIDAIKDAKAMTDGEWIEQWSKSGGSEKYISRSMWISYLEHCALQAAECFAQQAAA